jgi:hypothetical protein
MWSHGLKLICLFAFSAVLSLGLSAQEASPTNSTLTPKEQALQLLDSLEQNNNEAANLSTQSEQDLQTALNDKSKLVDSLKKTASYSERLEKSLVVSQTVNKIAIPTVIIAVTTAVLIAIFKK